MEDLFNMLSSSARLDKSKRKKKRAHPHDIQLARSVPDGRRRLGDSGDDSDSDGDDRHHRDAFRDNDDDDDGNSDAAEAEIHHPTKKTKKHHTAEKLAQIHREEIAAFRRRMGIRLSDDNRHDASIPDPVWSFRDWKCPAWWGGGGQAMNTAGNSDHDPTNARANAKTTSHPALPTFGQIHQTLLSNIEHGKWVEPTPIQMQALPSLMERRDVMGCAPTGSGKTGAFVLPALMLAKCPEHVFYGTSAAGGGGGGVGTDETHNGANQSKKRKTQTSKSPSHTSQPQPDLQGHVRTVLLAPSRELASQLHREILRLSANMPGKLHSVLLSKSNAGLASSNKLGGKNGLDVLVSTPLRLVECIERGMRLRGVRLIVLDEADRLLDASDGGRDASGNRNEKDNGNHGKRDDKKNKKGIVNSNESSSDGDSDDDTEDEDGDNTSDVNNNNHNQSQSKPTASGTSQSRTFLQQIDSILTILPPTATRALFSATLGPSVRHLSESILRSPVDISTGSTADGGGAAVASNTIRQELKFVGREEGKLLAIRQMIREGITPPILIFLQSKERAQALFGELLYDGIRVDVIHAGRSPSAREASVAKFRKGETWVLICTDLVARGVDFKAVNLVINYDMPTDGVTYVHRIGRTGRAGREGRAITFFTEGDFENLRTVANVMRLSGCEVPEWMLSMKLRGGGGGSGRGGGIGGKKKRKRKNLVAPKRPDIDTTPLYDKKKKQRKLELINSSKRKKAVEGKDE